VSVAFSGPEVSACRFLGQKPTADVIRAASAAAAAKSAPQGDLRGSVDYKKHLAGVLVGRGLRQALSRLGVQA